jgi:hypothetical protein
VCFTSIYIFSIFAIWSYFGEKGRIEVDQSGREDRKVLEWGGEKGAWNSPPFQFVLDS